MARRTVKTTLSEEEYEKFRNRMSAAGYKRVSEYLRHLCSLDISGKRPGFFERLFGR